MILRGLLALLVSNPTAGWALRRGMLVHGARSPLAYIELLRDFSLAGHAEHIVCPTWVCNAEEDDIGASAPQLVEALRCEKEFVQFTTTEGAGDHCEQGARALYHARSFGWLALHGWRVTGADFSANGLARAARNAERAGVADRTDWWQIDARTFAAAERSYDLVTTHFLHPPDGAMVEVTTRLAQAVEPGGHLLVVGHAPSEAFSHLNASHRHALFLAADWLPGLPDDFEALVVEQRPRTVTRDGTTLEINDSTLFARRMA